MSHPQGVQNLADIKVWMGLEMVDSERETENRLQEPAKPAPGSKPAGPRLSFGSRHVPLPQTKALRIVIGGLLVVFGLLGFLPVLGFWMIPLGLVVLSHDFPVVRRQKRRLVVWWGRRRQARRKAKAS